MPQVGGALQELLRHLEAGLSLDLLAEVPLRDDEVAGTAVSTSRSWPRRRVRAGRRPARCGASPAPCWMSTVPFVAHRPDVVLVGVLLRELHVHVRAAAGSGAAGQRLVAGQCGGGREGRGLGFGLPGGAARRRRHRRGGLAAVFLGDLLADRREGDAGDRLQRLEDPDPVQGRRLEVGSACRGSSASWSSSTGWMLRRSRLLYWKTSGIWSSASPSSAQVLLEVLERLDVGVRAGAPGCRPRTRSPSTPFSTSLRVAL